ncbi:MAG: hypothetical protein M8357_04265 [Desulfobulbaceae bacterium]|nr:hypothetical protein [Desulfobulbaceae bacterium]
MISNCPHCQTSLKLGDAQKAKLQKALDALEPGKILTIKCPSCTKPIKLEASRSSAAGNIGGITPPSPPDLGWLKESAVQEDDRIEDIPMALVLYPDNEQRDIVRDALEQVGYQVVFGKDIEEARERMRFVSFACVVLHSQFESPKLEDSTFHQYMRNMSMQRRRYLFYILVGPEFHTLYNLQALAYSANLLINDKDLYHMGIALRKAIPLYEEIFGAFMEELTSSGKS